jgi:uncharacterized protein (UPF0335 family)
MTEQLQGASGVPGLNLRQVRAFIDDLNRLQMEASQLATQVQIVRNRAKDMAWELAKAAGLEDQ